MIQQKFKTISFKTLSFFLELLLYKKYLGSMKHNFDMLSRGDIEKVPMKVQNTTKIHGNQTYCNNMLNV